MRRCNEGLENWVTEYPDFHMWEPKIIIEEILNGIQKRGRNKPMKIEILKPVTFASVSEVCRDAGDKMAGWALRSGIEPTLHYAYAIFTINQMPPNFRAWLEKNGFIREVEEFLPFTIRINTLEECTKMRHLTLLHKNEGLSAIWSQLNEYNKNIACKSEEPKYETSTRIDIR